LEFVPKPQLVATTLLACDDDQDGLAVFNLNQINGLVTNNSSYGPVVYFESLTAAQQFNLSQSILSPSSFVSAPKTIYAAVQTNFGCVTAVSISLGFSTTSVPQSISYASCDLDGTLDGFFGFTLANIDSLLLNGLPSGLVVSYYSTLADAHLGQNTLPALFTNSIVDAQTIFAKITNGADCFGISSINLKVNRNQPANFNDSTLFLCSLQSFDLSVDPIFNSYSWTTGANTPLISISQSNTYTITVTDANGCEARKNFIILDSSAPAIAAVQIEQFQATESSVQITVSGTGLYEYSLNGTDFQSSALFTNVPPNAYLLTVRDAHGCGKDTELIYVLDYPRFFTPNGDGFNDRWRIVNLNLVYNAQLRIFDRFGKLLQEFNEVSEGWDGNFLGKPLPADDYWFTIQFDTLKTCTGHFSLKR
jgi:gliding motility-associated-like protein